MRGKHAAGPKGSNTEGNSRYQRCDASRQTPSKGGVHSASSRSALNEVPSVSQQDLSGFDAKPASQAGSTAAYRVSPQASGTASPQAYYQQSVHSQQQAYYQQNTARGAAPAYVGASRSQAAAPAANQASFDMPTRTKGPWRAVGIIASIVLVAALVALGLIIFSYWQGQDQYKQLREVAQIEIPADENDLASMTVDWDALRATNPDIVGWIIMPNTEIDYPIVQTTDNEYYLNHSFDKSQNWLATYGTIFMDCTNNSQFLDSCTFFYGHHMNDGTMFAFLDKLTNQDTFNDNRVIYLLTPQGNYMLKTFAMVITTGSDMIVQTNFANAAAMDAYVQDKIDRSAVSCSDAVQPALDAMKIFGMSTCDYSVEDGRAVLFSYLAKSTVSGVKGVED